MPTNAQIQAVLDTLSEISEERRPQNKDGNLDVAEFNAMPEVLEAKETLRAMGITRTEQLQKRGFIVASMIIHFSVKCPHSNCDDEAKCIVCGKQL